MKKHLKKILFVLPLLFVAGIAIAAYSFTGPTQTPPNGNTGGPIDVSNTTQTKSGFLAVNAFQSRQGSAFAQQVSFAGLVRGGVSRAIAFGTTSQIVGIHDIGNTAITGNFQSDLLKTGGALKPICADAAGTFYSCDPTVIHPPNTTQITVYLIPTTDAGGAQAVYAHADDTGNRDVTVMISWTRNSGGTTGGNGGTGTAGAVTAMNTIYNKIATAIKNNFTALAYVQSGGTAGTTGGTSGGGNGGSTGTGGTTGGGGVLPACKQPGGQFSVTIPADNQDSNVIDTGPCDQSQITMSITSFIPGQTAGGRPYVASTVPYGSQ